MKKQTPSTICVEQKATFDGQFKFDHNLIHIQIKLPVEVNRDYGFAIDLNPEWKTNELFVAPLKKSFASDNLTYYECRLSLYSVTFDSKYVYYVAAIFVEEKLAFVCRFPYKGCKLIENVSSESETEANKDAENEEKDRIVDKVFDHLVML
jgi:hypothetical protein